MRNFKELIIWQNSMKIVAETFQFSQNLPKEEKFGLISQINRAVISIPANIAEGSSRESQKDFKRFLEIALGSLFELETFLLIIVQIGLCSEKQISSISNLIIEEQKMIHKFIIKLKESYKLIPNT